jgi:hypothetical protein
MPARCAATLGPARACWPPCCASLCPRTCWHACGIHAAMRRLGSTLAQGPARRTPASLVTPRRSVVLPCSAPACLQGLGTNHPASDYHDRPLLVFLEGASRDDCIYGLKQCAKKGHTLQPGCARWHACTPAFLHLINACPLRSVCNYGQLLPLSALFCASACSLAPGPSSGLAHTHPTPCCCCRCCLCRVMLEELQAGIQAAQAEADEKRRMGDPRQSYEATAKVGRAGSTVPHGACVALGGAGCTAGCAWASHRRSNATHILLRAPTCCCRRVPTASAKPTQAPAAAAPLGPAPAAPAWRRQLPPQPQLQRRGSSSHRLL